MENWKQVIVNLTQVSALKDVQSKAIEDWGTDIPTTVLFGALGQGIARDFTVYTLKEREYIFELIESSLNGGDENLKRFIATGLLEALYNRAGSDAVLLSQIEHHLGDSAKQYLAALEG